MEAYFLLGILCWQIHTASCFMDQKSPISESSHFRTNSLMEIQPDVRHIHNNTRDELYMIQDLMTIASSISPSHKIYIVYDLTFSEINTFLETYTKKYKEEFTVLELSEDLIRTHRILSITPKIVKTSRRHVLLLCSQDNVIAMFEMIRKQNLENPWIWWFIVVEQDFPIQMLENLIREGSMVILFQKTLEQKLNLLAYELTVDNKVRFHLMGHLKKTTQGYERYLSKSLTLDLDVIYTDFKGRIITATSKQHYPFIVMDERDDGENILLSGIDASVIMSLSKFLNFTYRMVIPPDRTWGGPQPDGTITGMIGVVARREAHFAVCEITITRARETVIDFTNPHYMESLTLISRTPKEKSRAFAAFTPFTPWVWLSIALFLLIMGPIMDLENYIMRQYMLDLPDLNIMNSIVYNMFRSLMKQGNCLPPNGLPMKLTLLFWDLFCLITSALYSGMLIAALISPSFEEPINSLLDMPKAVAEGYNLGVLSGTSNEFMFEEATEGLYADTYKLLNHEDRSKSFMPDDEVAYEKVLNEKLAYVVPQLVGTFIALGKGIDRFYFGLDTFSPQYYGIACNSGAPFKDKFNQMIMHMVEGGLVTKWIDNESIKAPSIRVVEESGGPRPFNLSHVQAAFYLLFIGFISSVVTFILEFIVAAI